MSAAQGGKRPRPPAKPPAAKTKAPASKAGARVGPKPRTGAGAKPRRRRAKKRRPSLLARLSGLPRLAWLGGLCLVLLGVVGAWWWGSSPALKGHPQATAPRAAAPAIPRKAPTTTPMPARPPEPPQQVAKTPAARHLEPANGVASKPPASAPASKEAAADKPPVAAPVATPSVEKPAHGDVPASTTTATSTPPAPPPARQRVLPMPPLPYEEPQAGATAQAQLQAVDEAIFAALRQGGLEPQQIHIQVNGDPPGEVTVLEARLRPGQETRGLRQALDQALAHTPARLAWQAQPQGLGLQVWLGQGLTHRLSLLSPSPAPQGLTPPPTHLPPPPALPPGARPRVALVIDDMGYQVEAARRLMALDLRLTLSILPLAPHAREIAEMARRQGVPVMAHLPMEPRTYPALNPGPGALLTSMDPETLARQTRQNLEHLPGAVGANNHMGSRFSEDPAALRPVLEVLRQQGLFFLDSVTSPRSQARDLARRMGLVNGQRDVFLDHDPTTGAITQQVLRLIRLAKTQGQAIAIGHPHATTIAVLTSMAPRLKQEVELVPVRQLLTPAGQAELDSRAARP
ncbi:MAG: divergent polysaccharide deacetylase family protein [Pseudomonadota bacterium]